MIYGVDIGNHVYAMNQAIPAYNPMVNDTERASKGFKRITLTYFFNDAERAESLGLEVLRLKNGDVLPKYGSRCCVYDHAQQKPKLKIAGDL
jgi:hypothetical protein